MCVQIIQSINGDWTTASVATAMKYPQQNPSNDYKLHLVKKKS